MKYEVFVFSLISLELVVVSFIDLKKKVISNGWSFFHIIFFVISWLFFDNSLVVEQFYFPLGFLFFGFLLFVLNIMGAGDSKYLSSLMLILPEKYHFIFFESLLYATILVGSILLIIKLKNEYNKIRAFLLSRFWKGLAQTIKSDFSFAPVIFIAWILTWVRVLKI